MAHQTAGVQEAPRALAVPASAPAVGHQLIRATAVAVVVPFNYSAGQKQGGP